MKISKKELVVLDQILLQAKGYPIIDINLKLGLSSDVIEKLSSKIEQGSKIEELDISREDLALLLRIISLICLELNEELPIVTGYRLSEVERIYFSLNNLLKNS